MITMDAMYKMTEPQQKLWDLFETVHFTNPVPELSSQLFFTTQEIMLAVKYGEVESFHAAQNSCFGYWNNLERTLLQNISEIFYCKS